MIFLHTCSYSYILSIALALGKIQWSALVTGRYMITVMVLLCYINMSGMSECITSNCNNEQFTVFRWPRVY